MGRPKKEIDKKLFEALCALQCTLPEFEDQLGVSDKTLNAWCKREYGESFSDTFAKKRGAGKVSLRRMQWRLAEKSAAMAIFLGKQYLDQRDAPGGSVAESNAADPLTIALEEMMRNAAKRKAN